MPEVIKEGLSLGYDPRQFPVLALWKNSSPVGLCGGWSRRRIFPNLKDSSGSKGAGGRFCAGRDAHGGAGMAVHSTRQVVVPSSKGIAGLQGHEARVFMRSRGRRGRLGERMRIWPDRDALRLRGAESGGLWSVSSLWIRPCCGLELSIRLVLAGLWMNASNFGRRACGMSNLVVSSATRPPNGAILRSSGLFWCVWQGICYTATFCVSAATGVCLASPRAAAFLYLSKAVSSSMVDRTRFVNSA